MHFCFICSVNFFIIDLVVTVVLAPSLGFLVLMINFNWGDVLD